MNPKYEAVIGLEVHAQLLTLSKIFCGCSTEFGNPPNTNVCPVCLGHPGILPVLNKKVVDYAIKMGLATNCNINSKSILARKNYFYPDLPKGYQISQYELPLCENGFLEIKLNNGSTKKIGITRIHIEEDAGKSIHDQSDATLIDVNRCGVPLIEIVSDPDISTPEEAYKYLSKIKQLVQYLEICDANMEEGSLRCDANISVRLKGENKFGTKTELKNMNSFRNVERALTYEINRQIDLLEDGEKIIQQTLLWNADENRAVAMRGKEEAHDYRYFPEPDLMPVEIDDNYKNEILLSLPELPDKRFERFVNDFLLPEYDAEILTSSKNIADYFEEVIKVTDDKKSASNWIMGEVLKVINENKIDINQFQIEAKYLGNLIELINSGTISGKIAKTVFDEMLTNPKSPDQIVKEKNLIQISDDSQIENMINEVISNFPDEIQQYIEGKDKVLGFFVGKIMQHSKGKANPQKVNQILKKILDLKK